MDIQFYQEERKLFRVYGKINERNEPENSERAALFSRRNSRDPSESLLPLQSRNSSATQNPENTSVGLGGGVSAKLSAIFRIGPTSRCYTLVPPSFSRWERNRRDAGMYHWFTSEILRTTLSSSSSGRSRLRVVLSSAVQNRRELMGKS